ncbi:MAG: gliding motility lipoprotein GldH [Cyclobacteriaceae bacterium]|jgi:gliding motility-associated lipoprotein GldH
MRILVGVICLMLVAGCDRSRVFEDNHDFESRLWAVHDTVRFTFRIAETTQRYNVYYNIRSSRHYPWSRLFVNWSLQDSSRNQLKASLASAYLFDPKTGKPLGESALGDLYDQQFPLLTDYAFQTAGPYTVSLQQFMRTDSLPGILSAGIRVERAQRP